MNAAFLIMSSAALAGADPTPPPAAHHAPVVVSGTGGCSNCGTPAYTSDCGGCKPSILDRLKSRFGKKSHDCGCAPACAPAPVCAPAPCNSCPTSVASRPNLFDKLKSRWGCKKHHGPSCDPCGATTVGGCASPLPAGAVPVTPGTAIPPKEMPKPKDVKPVDPKPKGGNSTSAPVPFPAIPTVNGAGLTGAPSPY